MEPAHGEKPPARGAGFPGWRLTRLTGAQQSPGGQGLRESAQAGLAHVDSGQPPFHSERASGWQRVQGRVSPSVLPVEMRKVEKECFPSSWSSPDSRTYARLLLSRLVLPSAPEGMLYPHSAEREREARPDDRTQALGGKSGRTPALRTSLTFSAPVPPACLDEGGVARSREESLQNRWMGKPLV